ncbi:winged helix-turn-helix domain-containing protein [Micromonospora sp. NBC_01655]|uniref:winged helix-turn-helix domain-containing protein n=1 Tax=Micromonospora sp. NBC_01655 TaxID=2975983 RepID=UPI00224CC5FF|nr:winged helix-turn-helix domain-containing protein [Micromonospora sp. NBC_01655]MCX4474765.1 winged helix-turn-helix domain-containing protein [Micromonospora sp. NBC_01655]
MYREIITTSRRGDQGRGLQPGDRLPTIAQLCEQYQASNTPVKTAMRLLEEMGLIETWQGKGMFVRQRTEDAK